MRKVIYVMVAMLFLLTACESPETSSEKENTKTEGVEDSNVDSTKNTSNTDSNATVEKIDENTNEKEEERVNVSIEKEAATPANESLKEKYLKILNDTKAKTDNIVPVDSTTPSLNQAEGERYELWDRLLNEVYGVLKSQLSVKEMDQLRIKQREWIIYRDNKAKEASFVSGGGTAEKLMYLGELANQTEIRCYTLVNDYMK